MKYSTIDDASKVLSRVCRGCEASYRIGDYELSARYFDPPYDYVEGCTENCLSCWLGVEPAAEDDDDDFLDDDGLTGDLVQDFGHYLASGHHLAILPISRVQLEFGCHLIFDRGITFYPPGDVQFQGLNVQPNIRGRTLAEDVSALSGIDVEVLESHPLIVFPCRFDWDEFRRSGFRDHHTFIRTLSEYVDRWCLDLVRYRECSLEWVHALPGRAGMVKTNSMMAGTLLYNHSKRESRIIGGDVFTHSVTRGVGLSIASVETGDFVIRDGGVGNIVRMGLQHYTALLETDNQTQKFVQAMSLLEFLAYPDEYAKFQEVKKVVASYAAANHEDYMRLLERFLELTGKKDDATNKVEGYRTRLVHLGHRLEDILPDESDRKALFSELQVYIKKMINHMLDHSEKSWEEYLKVRPSHAGQPPKMNKKSKKG